MKLFHRASFGLLLVSLVHSPAPAFSCFFASHEIRQAIGLAPDGESLWFLEGDIRRTRSGCVTHEFTAVRYSWDRRELERRPVFQEGIPGERSVPRGQACEVERGHPMPMIEPMVVLRKARRAAPFRGLQRLGMPAREAPVSVVWPEAARDFDPLMLDDERPKTNVEVTTKSGERQTFEAPHGFERRAKPLYWNPTHRAFIAQNTYDVSISHHAETRSETWIIKLGDRQ